MNKLRPYIYIFFCSCFACFAWGMEIRKTKEIKKEDSTSPRKKENEVKRTDKIIKKRKATNYTAKDFKEMFALFQTKADQSFAPLVNIRLLLKNGEKTELRTLMVRGDKSKITDSDKNKLKIDKIQLDEKDRAWINIAYFASKAWIDMTYDMKEFERKKFPNENWISKQFGLYLKFNGKKGAYTDATGKKLALGEKDIDLLFFLLDINVIDKFFNIGDKEIKLSQAGQWYIKPSTVITSKIFTPEELDKFGILRREIIFAEKDEKTNSLVERSLGVVFIPGRGCYAMSSRKMEPLRFDKWDEDQRFVSPLSLLQYLSEPHSDQPAKIKLSRYVRSVN